MPRDGAFVTVLARMEVLDERGISDVAHHWAEIEAGIVAAPENDGARRMELALSFEAGRIYEQELALAQHPVAPAPADESEGT
jgi:hypothetical protein